MSLSKELTISAKLLSPYVEATDRHALTSELLEKGVDPLSSTGNVDLASSDIKNLAANLYEIVDGGVSITKFVHMLNQFITSDKSNDVLKNSIKKFIRITLPGDVSNINRKSAQSITPSDSCYINNLKNYKDFEGFSGDAELNLASGGITFLNVQSNTSETVDGLYAIEFMNPRFGLGSRDTPSIGIFTSLIPVLEMSRCVPYLNVKIKSTGSTVNPPAYNGLSLMSFLVGRGEPVNANQNSFDTILSFDKLNVPVTAGMELFTSPQTLVPTRDSAVFREEGRGPGQNVNNIQPVLDRFRPLMTLKGISFSVASTKGFMSYKSAKLELILHDRSRLGEIAYFVKPGLYTKVDLNIEYGWSHPSSNKISQDADKNPIGSFLNSMKVKEKYTVVNSSFNFDDTGQVGVSLSLAMKGASDIISLDISKCGSSDAAHELKIILEEIGELISNAKTTDGERFEKLFGDVVMSAVGSTSSALSIDGEKLDELKKKIASIKTNASSPNDKQLAAKLDNLFNATDSVKYKYKQSASDAVQNELNALASGIEIFPCADSQISGGSGIDVKLFEDPKSPTGLTSQILNNPISLGRILLSFVGKPLVKSGNYAEVHFLFHTFNDKCTFMRDLSIAKFPIPYEFLKQEIVELMSKNVKVDIMKFIGMLNSRFVGNNASHAYGFNFLYEVDKETQEYVRKKPSDDATESTKESFEALQYSKQDAIVKLSGIRDGVFKIPKLSIMPECVQDKDKPERSILRMHVIDETCSSFSTLADLLRSANSVDIGSFGFTNDPQHPILTKSPELDSSEIEKNRLTTLQRLKNEGIITNLEARVDAVGTGTETQATIDIGNILQNKSISKTKKFISRGIPTIRYGSGGGTINNIGLSSMSDPALTTVNMLRMDKTDSSTPDISEQRGLPMQVSPTECTLEMMGCPLLSFGQQFFIDFGTGTTADNTYSVTGIDHKLDPGSFTTSVKLTFTDSYAKYTSPSRKIRTASTLFKNAAAESRHEASEEPTNINSGLVDRTTASTNKSFFAVTESTNEIPKIYNALSAATTGLDFAMIVSEGDCKFYKYFIGKGAKDNAIKEAANLDAKYCVITFFATTNMSERNGPKYATVINPSSQKSVGDNVINTLQRIGEPANGPGTITIDLEDFAKYAGENFKPPKPTPKKVKTKTKTAAPASNTPSAKVTPPVVKPAPVTPPVVKPAPVDSRPLSTGRGRILM